MDARIIPAVTVLALVALIAAGNFERMNGYLTPWYDPVVTRDEVALAQWADGNVPHNSLFAADLFACEMLTATARAICSVGGAWELTDNANGRFYDNERAFLANSSRGAWEIFGKYNDTLIFTSERTSFYGYGYKQPDNAKFGDGKYFELVKQVGGARIYRLKAA